MPGATAPGPQVGIHSRVRLESLRVHLRVSTVAVEHGVSLLSLTEDDAPPEPAARSLVVPVAQVLGPGVEGNAVAAVAFRCGAALGFHSQAGQCALYEFTPIGGSDCGELGDGRT